MHNHVPLVPHVLAEQRLSPLVGLLAALVLHLHHLGETDSQGPTPALDAELHTRRLFPWLIFSTWDVSSY